ncbi:uncharacterized protein YbjT (DUF2867 family) [Silvimonas terrae]|uniref:Uncharacterized protein YbjT (DUF2867 family) n=1 Tax=Silvimonas terrae TaxID=300266 RepID=A0A840RFC7_9NEIS|nr:NAD(P)H-binding protein [Silvimonas terrae]MBB5191727.1 uncharacterized protein YbjT (DUF2867 family) [Silvimonas terrae]
MKVLLTGASGFIGRNISAALTTQGHEVVPVSRRHGVDFAQMQAPACWLPYLDGVGAVVNCVGIIGPRGSQCFNTLHTIAPSALFTACAQVGVRRVVQISALGADNAAFSAYHRSKRDADDHLRSLDLDWFVLRPSLIYGRGGTSADLLLRLARLPLIPVIAGGQQPLQPVHISDVVAAVLQSISAPQTRLTLDVAGSQIFSFIHWLDLMRKAQGLAPGRFVSIPFALAMAGTRLGRPISPMLQPDNLRMLQAGYQCDIEAFARFLGRMPLVVEPDLFFSDATLKRGQS